MNNLQYVFGQLIDKQLGRKDLSEIFALARDKQKIMLELPLTRILDVLEETGKLWQDPHYPGRITAIRELPALTGFSAPMVELGINAVTELLQRKNLEKKLNASKVSPAYLEGWGRRNEERLRAFPLGLVLHVGAGNVFVGAVDSLVHGFLSKNINLLKISSQDPLFPLLFARSLAESDPEGILSQSFGILNFRGGEKELEELLKQNCDAIVVWGGEATVKAYRQDLPLSCKLIEYGPKYSFAWLTEAGLKREPEALDLLARDIILWDQRACSSPQVAFIEESPDFPIRQIAEKLADGLEKAAQELPPGKISVDEKVEITRVREEGEVAQAAGEGLVLYSGGRTAYTIIIEESCGFTFSPLNRVIFLKPYRKISRVIDSLTPLKGYLQTAGVLSSPLELQFLVDCLAECGVTRITPLGKMLEVNPEAPHDGGFQLEQLIKWVNLEDFSSEFVREEKLLELVEFARQNSPFYRARFSGMEFIGLESLPELPVLRAEEVRRNTPPLGEALLTAPVSACYIFSSGGTSGEAKFIFYTPQEWEETTSMLAQVYNLAGVCRGDRVANLFMAGSLWTSFLAVNSALEKLGCVVLPIGGNVDKDQIIKYVEELKPDILVSLPTILSEVARGMKDKGIKLKAVLYGGENLNPAARKLLQEVFNPDIILSAGYASVDAGVIGFQTPFCERGVHHLLWDYQIMKMIDPVTGEIAPEGEIVVTNLGKRLLPVIHYGTGDRGKWRMCSCGRPEPAFELTGRVTEVIRIGTADLRASDIEKALEYFPQISPVFQLEISSRKEKEYLKLKIEIENGDIVELSERLKEKLLEINHELKDALERGWVSRFVVEAGFPGFIPRVARTGKVARIIDNRQVS